MKHWSTWTLAGLLCLAGTAWAGTADPGIDHRQAVQHARIERGIASGALTAREARHLEARERAISAKERAFKSDGELTVAERRKLHRDLDRTSRAIAVQKHDAQHR